MAAKQNSKRAAPQPQGPYKKRRLNSTAAVSKHSTDHLNKAKKEKAFHKKFVEIPSRPIESDVELSDQDLDALQTYGTAISFLDHLDERGITRSKTETQRLHQMNQPARARPQMEDLPSLNSDDENELDGREDSWDTGTDDAVSSEELTDDSDAEMPYERAPRARRPPSKTPMLGIRRLPIKLPDGKVQDTGEKISISSNNDSDEEPKYSALESEIQPIEDVSTGARFGRPAVIDVLTIKSKEERVRAAKEQIAQLCQEILADPENGLGLLRRLHTFSSATISSPNHPKPVPNHPLIRKLAILSQLAIFKDILPGYRIRSLTEKENAEKVSQMVARTRDWEQGLVLAYQTYLKSLESEMKARSELANVALKCMCTLLAEVTHFNFRDSLTCCIVARLSKKTWDESSEMCLQTLIRVFKGDHSGAVSLEVVRVMNRMIKGKKFKVHPNVLSCLLHLRLKTELGVRASDKGATSTSPESTARNKKTSRRPKAKEGPHLSKKAKKALKEKKEIEKELHEAEAEVDREEREIMQTETLKLLFVLYFRILKNPSRTPLLSAALRGISKFAHLVNIDFFRDLMKVLKDLVSQERETDTFNIMDDATQIRHRLLCIVTAFELLSGQGEALNIDLSDFITLLYSLILPLSSMQSVDASISDCSRRQGQPESTIDMLFYALGKVFSPRSFGTTASPWRSAAFAKRLLTAALHWPPATALRALEFVGGLLEKDPKLEALLSTDDRTYDGAYQPHVDDPQLCHPFGTSFWELLTLRDRHYDSRVKEQAARLLNFTRT